jgi:hypothetical protein
LYPYKKIDWTRPENNIDPLSKKKDNPVTENYRNTALQRAQKITASLEIPDQQKVERLE